jgi:putative nucleotidyltransferase with HDIG domain
MRKEFEKAVKEGKKLNSLLGDSAHSFEHSESVVKSALKIAEEYPEVDSDLIEVAGWWHDVGRLHDNENHERVSAEMLKNFLKELKVEEEVCEKAYNAVVFHRWSMKPETIEGEIIRDADKLDFISIKRWKHLLNDNNMKVLNDISRHLPVLREKLLHLDASKRIYDQKISAFKDFIKKNN